MILITKIRLLILILSLGLVLACERPPLVRNGPSNNGEDRVGPVDFESFLQDRPAVGGDWYLYDEEGGHLLTPFDQAYVIEDGDVDPPRYAALRIHSYYDPNTAESGTFTLGIATWDGSAWSDEDDWLTPKDIKVDGPLCVDVFAQNDINCELGGWQVQLRTYPFMALAGPLLVNRPGLFVRSAEGIDAGNVRAATVTPFFGYDAIGDPALIEGFEDQEAPSWSNLTWGFDRFAVNLPQAGMSLGSRVFASGFATKADVMFMITGNRDLVKFTIEPVVELDRESGLAVRFSRTDIDLSDNTVPDTFDNEFSVEVPTPALGEVRYLAFRNDDLELERGLLDDIAPPHLPAKENRWDIAVQRNDDGNVRLILSPAGAIYNVTELDGVTVFEEALPPTL